MTESKYLKSVKIDKCSEQLSPEWIKLSSQEVADYKIFKIFSRRFKNPKTEQVGDFLLAKSNDWVQVIAETDCGKFVMVKQFRFGSEDFSLELPGGIMDAGETEIEAARRELEEETGYCGETAALITRMYPNPAIQTNLVNVVLIKNCKKLKNTKFDEFEDLQTIIMTKDEIIDAIRSSEISHCIPVAGILKYFFCS